MLEGQKKENEASGGMGYKSVGKWRNRFKERSVERRS